jgi:hypothetical protein
VRRGNGAAAPRLLGWGGKTTTASAIARWTCGASFAALALAGAPQNGWSQGAPAPPENGADAKAPAVEAPSLTGRWAQLQVVTSLEDIPVLGEVTTTMAVTMLLDIQQEGSALQVREQMCHIAFRSSSDLVEIEVPAAFARSLSGNLRTGRVREAAGKRQVTLDRLLMVGGMELANPESDSLPNKTSDPRVRDSDGDGFPGLTLQSRGTIEGAIRIVQRSWNVLRGVVTDPDTVSGKLQWASERRVIDADSVLLEVEPESRPHPDPGRNIFRWVRVSNTTDCTDVAKNSRKLFGNK